jgi:hypothetical protein
MNANTKYCNCSGCNYANQHITSYHKCGACGTFGHGLRECHKNNKGSYDKINALHELNYTETLISHNGEGIPFYNTALKITGLPEHLHCKHPSCKTKFTHSTNSHQELFSKDKFGGLSGPDQYGITARAAYINEYGPKCVQGIPNSYTTMYWGMGNTFIFRNIGGKIEHIDTEGNYDEYVKGLKYIKCE